MTKEDRGHYAKKHDPNRRINQIIADAVKRRASDDEMACAVAFSIAADLGVSPAEVGFTLDMLEIRLIKCQLGLFGYGHRKSIIKPPEKVSRPLEEGIQMYTVNNRLPCEAAWRIAKDLDIGKMEVSSACDALGIKISPCQLGSF